MGQRGDPRTPRASSPKRARYARASRILPSPPAAIMTPPSLPPDTIPETPDLDSVAAISRSPMPILTPVSQFPAPEPLTPTPVLSPYTPSSPSSSYQQGFHFNKLPSELRLAILSCLIDYWVEGDRSSIAPYATVNREWQAAIETYNFSRIRVTAERAHEFSRIFANSQRRRYLRRLLVHVDLPRYDNDPCELKETLDDKIRNNSIFTATLGHIFLAMSEWQDSEVAREGVGMVLSISSPSDLRNSQFDLWQRRRWSVRDIGERRFQDSYIDFLGMDEESRTNWLRPVYAITSFETSPFIRRAVMPAAYADLIAKLPRLRTVSMDWIKERRVNIRRAMFDQFAAVTPRWSPDIESLTITANTNSSWRDLPHEKISEKDSGKKLCESLRALSRSLKHLSITNVVRVREFFRPVWPTGPEDREPFPANGPYLPMFEGLETLRIVYSGIYYLSGWTRYHEDLNDHEDLIQFRQSLSLATARLAMLMPNLRHMVVAQRPLMWAGRHHFVYCVGPPSAKPSPLAGPRGAGPMRKKTYQRTGDKRTRAQGLTHSAQTGIEASATWTSTFEFNPSEKVMDAWTEVANVNTGLPLVVNVSTEKGWRTDGSPPTVPGVMF